MLWGEALLGDRKRTTGFTPQDKVLAFVRVAETGCWLWTAARMPSGYGMLYWGNRNVGAHRASWEAFKGEIPEGYVVDHLCRNKTCVNPDHLEPVTQQTNNLRGTSLSAKRARQTSCIHGHAFDEANTYRWRGGRVCRKCGAERSLRYHHARRDEIEREMTQEDAERGL